MRTFGLKQMIKGSHRASPNAHSLIRNLFCLRLTPFPILETPGALGYDALDLYSGGIHYGMDEACVLFRRGRVGNFGGTLGEGGGTRDVRVGADRRG